MEFSFTYYEEIDSLHADIKLWKSISEVNLSTKCIVSHIKGELGSFWCSRGYV